MAQLGAAVVTEALEPVLRREAGRVLAALLRVFGVENLALAEDVTAAALERARRRWTSGLPEDAPAWLLLTARELAPDAPPGDPFGAEATRQDLMRLVLSCCQPRLAEEAQVALLLHFVCGFDARAIARAESAPEDAVRERLAGAKKIFSASRRLFEPGDADFGARLTAAQRALYRLFDDGCHDAASERARSIERCEEAMRMAALLREHRQTATPATHALGALMCLRAARLFQPDPARPDRALIAEGQGLLDVAATGAEVSEYHVEAAIASLHAEARRPEDTAWDLVAFLYDTLMRLRPSPEVANALARARDEMARKRIRAERAVLES